MSTAWQMTVETWTTSEVREFLGLGSNRATRIQLARWGIEAVGRAVDSGEKLWNAEQVRTARDNRPGRGTRTDLKEKAMETEKVTENYQPAPGRMDTRTFWIAYPAHVAEYGHMSDRVERAWGRGKTEEEALAKANASARECFG